MSDEPKTICVQCQHYLGDRNAVDVDPQCAANPRPTAIDPVSGLLLPYDISELVDKVFGGATYHLCREVNFGHCSAFTAREESC